MKELEVSPSFLIGHVCNCKCADFAILEKDPTAVDPTTIKSIKVVETWLDGYKRHTRIGRTTAIGKTESGLRLTGPGPTAEDRPTAALDPSATHGMPLSCHPGRMEQTFDCPLCLPGVGSHELTYSLHVVMVGPMAGNPAAKAASQPAELLS